MEPIVITVQLNAPLFKVWNAITDNEALKKWYFQIEEFRPEPGFKFEFLGGDEQNQYVHLCEVKEVIPLKKLSYTWNYEGYAGSTLVSFELEPEGTHKTKIKVTHDGLESLGDSPQFARKNFVAGWTEILNTMLKEYIEKVSAT